MMEEPRDLRPLKAMTEHFYARNGRYPTLREIIEIMERETGGEDSSEDPQCSGGFYRVWRFPFP